MLNIYWLLTNSSTIINNSLYFIVPSHFQWHIKEAIICSWVRYYGVSVAPLLKLPLKLTNGIGNLYIDITGGLALKTEVQWTSMPTFNNVKYIPRPNNQSFIHHPIANHAKWMAVVTRLLNQDDQTDWGDQWPWRPDKSSPGPQWIEYERSGGRTV